MLLLEEESCSVPATQMVRKKILMGGPCAGGNNASLQVKDSICKISRRLIHKTEMYIVLTLIVPKRVCSNICFLINQFFDFNFFIGLCRTFYIWVM